MSPAAPSPASRYLAAAVQFEPTMFAKEANVARLLDLCEEAAERGAKLIVTPDLLRCDAYATEFLLSRLRFQTLS